MPGPLPRLLYRPHALHSRCGRIARGASSRERRCTCLQHCSSQDSHPQAPSQALQHPASKWLVIQVSYVLAKSWCKGARTKSCSSSQLLLNKHLHKRCRALRCTGLHWSSMSTEVGCAQTVLSETVHHHLLHQHGVTLGCCVQTLFDLVPAQDLPKQAYVPVKVGCAQKALSETAHCPPAVSIQYPPWLLRTRSGSSCPRRALRCAGAPECAPAAGCPAPARQSVCLSACPSDALDLQAHAHSTAQGRLVLAAKHLQGNGHCVCQLWGTRPKRPSRTCKLSCVAQHRKGWLVHQHLQEGKGDRHVSMVDAGTHQA